jgi:hypothetical protein
MKLSNLSEAFYQDDFNGRMDPALEDLFSALRRTREGNYADYRRTNESEFEVRHFGKWVGDDGSGDYDWQTLSRETSKQVNDLVKQIQKKHRVKIDWQTGEKNWMYFKLLKKARAANSVDPNPAAGNRAQRVLEIVTSNPTASRQELIQMVVRNTGMTPAGAASYIWKAQKALKGQS